MDTDLLAEHTRALCDNLTETQDDLAREVLSRTAGKWSLWVLSVLAEADTPLRFSRVLERVEGISQKVLTQALRQLERDGFVSRKLYPQVPPRVDYALTPLGRALLLQVLPLWSWVAREIGEIEAARRRFDAAAEAT
jgi:DNA-binding HxlR family transcriptional regulator